MKRLPYIIVLTVISLIIVALVPKRCKGNNTTSNDQAIIDEEVVDAIEPEEEVVLSERDYRGDSITSYGDVILYANYGNEEYELADDVSAKDDTYLTRYVNDKCKDSIVLVGPNTQLIGAGKYCHIIVGVDTVTIDITKPLSDKIDLRYVGILPKCKFYRLSKHYTLNDSARTTDFQINVAIPDSVPLYIKDFISGVIRDDVASYFSHYSGDDIIDPHLPTMKMKGKTINEMSKYYYKQFCKLYFQEFGSNIEPGERAFGEWYSYQFYVYPVWENKDKSLTTWKFYNFGYLGGAHGSETEYYLTFDNKTGRVLGIKDFYSSKAFRDAMQLLTRELNIRQGRDLDGEWKIVARLDDYENITAAQSNVLNDVIDSEIYPRPAITRHGMVFSYQTYEKGSNADGILHFILPFKQDFKLKR